MKLNLNKNIHYKTCYITCFKCSVLKQTLQMWQFVWGKQLTVFRQRKKWILHIESHRPSLGVSRRCFRSAASSSSVHCLLSLPDPPASVSAETPEHWLNITDKAAKTETYFKQTEDCRTSMLSIHFNPTPLIKGGLLFKLHCQLNGAVWVKYLLSPKSCW